MKPYAIQTVPYHENGTVGFSLRELIGDAAGKPARDPDGFEVFYQDGRESRQIDPADICHGVLEDTEKTKARLTKKGQGYVDSFPNWSEDTMKSQERWVGMWERWSRGEFTDEEIEQNRRKSDLIWMSGDELDAWEAANIAAVANPGGASTDVIVDVLVGGKSIFNDASPEVPKVAEGELFTVEVRSAAGQPEQ
jgi:hypothetical protein